mgnify:CR=1 FL=1
MANKFQIRSRTWNLIAGIGSAPAGFVATRTIDATGLVVAPGLVDLSARLRDSETAFVFPTTVHGETVARLAIVNPRTTLEDLRVVLDSMR